MKTRKIVFALVVLLPVVLTNSQASSGQTCVSAPTGAVAWWQGEGDAADRYASNSGMVQKGVGFASGNVGQAMNFDGQNDFVVVPDNPNLRIATTVSIEFWAKRLRSSALGFPEIVVEKGGDWTQNQTNYGVGLHNSGFGNPLYFFYAGGFRGVAGPSDLGWHHYAVIAAHGQSNPRFFIDGVEQTNITFSGGTSTINLATNDLPLHIGAQVGGGIDIFGNLSIDELTIFNRALTPVEISSIFNAGSFGKCPASCAPQPSGIVSWWRGEGNANDARNLHNGTPVNGTTFATGRVGQAFSFDGNDDAVDLGPWFDLQTFTIELWVMSNGSQQTWADIIDNNHTNNRSWVVQYDNIGNQFHYGAVGTGGDIFFNVTPGRWHHIVITRDVNGATVGYQNSAAVGSVASMNPIIYDGTQFLRLSNWGGGGRHFNGLIDEVTIYNRALSPGRVAALFRSGAAGKCAARSAGRADFDGDGRTDLSVFRPSDGVWYQNRSTEGLVQARWGVSSDTPVGGDFDGDGKTDLAVFRPSSTTGVSDFFVLNSSTSTLSGFEWGVPGDLPVTADYDGDNKTDLAVFRPSINTWYVRRSTDNTALVEFFGTTGDVPIPMDHDDDGRADLAVFRTSTNTWYMARTAGIPAQDFIAVPFGLAGDKPVPADYNADGRDEIAVYRPSNGVWYIRNDDGTITYTTFGNSTDVLVPGDYDGDERSDVAIFRNGQWWLNRSSNGLLVTSFGLSSDIPIPARYIP